MNLSWIVLYRILLICNILPCFFSVLVIISCSVTTSSYFQSVIFHVLLLCSLDESLNGFAITLTHYPYAHHGYITYRISDGAVVTVDALTTNGANARLFTGNSLGKVMAWNISG